MPKQLTLAFETNQREATREVKAPQGSTKPVLDLNPQKIEAELLALIRPPRTLNRIKDTDAPVPLPRKIRAELTLRVRAKNTLSGRSSIRVSDVRYDYDIIFNPKKIRTQAQYDDFMKTCRHTINFGA